MFPLVITLIRATYAQAAFVTTDSDGIVQRLLTSFSGLKTLPGEPMGTPERAMYRHLEMTYRAFESMIARTYHGTIAGVGRALYDSPLSREEQLILDDILRSANNLATALNVDWPPLVLTYSGFP